MNDLDTRTSDKTSSLEKLLRSWWQRLLAWLRSPERKEQASRAAESAEHAATAAGKAARSTLKEARTALDDLRHSETGQKAEAKLRDLRTELRDGETGRRARAALRDLRGSDRAGAGHGSTPGDPRD